MFDFGGISTGKISLPGGGSGTERGSRIMPLGGLERRARLVEGAGMGGAAEGVSEHDRSRTCRSGEQRVASAETTGSREGR